MHPLTQAGTHMSEVRPALDRLSHRQLLVLHFTCKGLRNQEIARQLGVCERSVKAYISQLFLIFDVTNRTELVDVIGEELRNDLVTRVSRIEDGLPEGAAPLDIYKASGGG